MLHKFDDETTYIECSATGRKYKIRRDTHATRKTLLHILLHSSCFCEICTLSKSFQTSIKYSNKYPISNIVYYRYLSNQYLSNYPLINIAINVIFLYIYLYTYFILTTNHQLATSQTYQTNQFNMIYIYQVNLKQVKERQGFS